MTKELELDIIRELSAQVRRLAEIIECLRNTIDLLQMVDAHLEQRIERLEHPQTVSNK